MPYFAWMIGIDERQQRFAHFLVARGDVEHGDLRARESVAEDADDAGAHRFGEFIEPEIAVGAGDFLQHQLRIADPEIVGAESAHAHDAEILIAHHDRIRGAPFVAGEEAGGDEIDVGFEGRIEGVFPRLQLGEDRDVSVVRVCLPGPKVSPNSPR